MTALPRIIHGSNSVLVEPGPATQDSTNATDHGAKCTTWRCTLGVADQHLANQRGRQCPAFTMVNSVIPDNSDAWNPFSSWFLAGRHKQELPEVIGNLET